MKKTLLGSLLLIVLALGARETDSQNFRLIHADRLYMNNLESGQVLRLNGAVHFFYGDIEFYGDRALILDAQKIARLSGNVVVKNDSLHLVADSLAYYHIPELLNLGGRVRLTQSTREGKDRWLQGDHGIYDQAKDTFTVWSRVTGYDEEENAVADCGYAFWDRAAGYAFLIEEPKVRAGDPDTLFINADKMEYFEEERKLIATFNVQTQSRDYHVDSDFLIYFANEERAVFLGEPHFYNDFATATAREFHLYMEGEDLRRVVLMDSCEVFFAREEGQEQDSWVRAANIELNFDEGRITDFSADAEVSYHFRQQEKPDQDFFINCATGDRLKAKFDQDNELELMDMGGRIKGVYKFKNDS